MAQPDSKVLVLGALAGFAGISLAVVCYQGYKSKRRSSCPALHVNQASQQGPSLMLVDGPSQPGGQVEVLERLEALIQCVSELKDEMKSLKSSLPALQDQVVGQLKSRRGRSLRTLPSRQRKPSSPSSPEEDRRSEDAESEAGYMTALTDSEEDESSDGEQHMEAQPVDRLGVLLEQIDHLHQGSETDKQQSLNLLLEQRAEFGQDSRFLWRLTRAYCDVHDISSSLNEKKAHAEAGKEVGEQAVTLNPACAESHQWYAIMCGIMAEYETVQNKIKNGYIFKDHLDKAIELKPQDPMSYYLLGRWCYAVAQLSWIERKVAATLFGEPPSATVEDALKNFLKVEELSPAYSKFNYVFLAKCFKDLGQTEEARRMCEAACTMETVSKEDGDAQKELDSLRPALGM